MSKTLRLVLIGLLVVALIGGVVLAIVWFSGGSGEASSTITAPTLDIAATSETSATPEAPEPVSTEEAAAPTQEAAAPTQEAAATPAAPETSASADLTLFRIVSEESEVRFKLDEDLGGNRITVTGITNQVAGDVAIDFANPANSQLGTIRINMRTLATDNEFRNRAIRSQILRTADNAFEFSDFVPTTIEGLPTESVAVGDDISFTVTGDFTINGITRPVTFDVVVTLAAQDRIEGTARAVVQRADFELNIPSVPNVANVEEEVELELDFVAAGV